MLHEDFRATSARVLLSLGAVLLAAPCWSEAQIRLIKDLRPGASGIALHRIETGDSLAYVIAEDAFLDYRLYRTDGSAEGSYELCPAYSYYAGGPAQLLATIGDRAVFVRNIAGTLQLWQSNGTVAGTGLVANLVGETDTLNAPGNFLSVGNRVFFTLGQGLLHATDGTSGDTGLVVNLYTEYGISSPGSAPGNFTRMFCAHEGDLCFVADGVDVWRSDGTPEGTRIVWSPEGLASEIGGLWGMPDGLYVAARYRNNETDLWRLPPQGGPAQRVYHVEGSLGGPYYGARDLAWMNGQAYFSVYGAQQLWRTSGGAQAVKIIEIPSPGCGPSCLPSIRNLTPTSRALVFSAQTAENGLELWTSDGTAGGTRLLKDFTPGTESASMYFFPFAGSDPIIVPYDAVSSTYSLWRTDGTDAGTEKLLQLDGSFLRPECVKEFMGGYVVSYYRLETGYEPHFLYEGTFEITRQPVSVGRVEVNSPTGFMVEAPDWARPWTQYQWLRNGVPIPGEVWPELVIFSAQYADAGVYTCRVTFDDGGSGITLVSAPASLQVVEQMSALGVPQMLLLSAFLCAAAAAVLARRNTPGRGIHLDALPPGP